MRAPRLSSAGFTLMELVLAIAIVGILSTVAISKSISNDNQARAASAASLAGSIATGSAINKASLAAGSGSAITVADASICNAASLSRFAQTTITPDVSISGSGDCSSGSDAVTCSISVGGQQANALVQCANNAGSMSAGGSSGVGHGSGSLLDPDNGGFGTVDGGPTPAPPLD